MDYDEANVPKHFYKTIETSSIDLIKKEHAKEEALYAMEHLHGWCTKSKASILIDLVFLANAEKVVEVGVWGGKSLIPMAFALQNMGNGKIYGIDPWSPAASIIGMTDVNKDWWETADHELVYQDLVKNIKRYNLSKYIELIRNDSEGADIIENIDILHIDGNHSEEKSCFDAYKWVPLVRKGGFIVFDDITWGTTNKAVDWLDENCVRVATFHEDNDWAVWIKP